MFARPRHDDRRIGLRPIGIDIANLRCQGAVALEIDESFGDGFVETHVKGFIGLGKYQVMRVRTDLVAVDFFPAQGLPMLPNVKYRFTVVRPHEVAGHRLDTVCQLSARGQIDDVNIVEAPADRIDSVSCQSLIRTYLESAHGKIGRVAGFLVDIQ